MKRKVIPLAALAATTILLSGCLSAPFQPPSGVIAVTRAPLSTEGNWNVGTKLGFVTTFKVTAYGE